MKFSKIIQYILIGAIYLTILGAAMWSTSSKVNAPTIKTESCKRVGTICYDLEKADTNESRIRGLSGREVLAENAGMLFVFDSDGEQCMWMKDTLISLDMIWLDSSKRVIKIEENITPDTFPTAFCPPSPARYVIELNQGEIKKNRILAGDTIDL